MGIRFISFYISVCRWFEHSFKCGIFLLFLAINKGTVFFFKRELSSEQSSISNPQVLDEYGSIKIGFV